MDVSGWIRTEFRSAEFGDKRLTDRLVQIGDELGSSPAESVAVSVDLGWYLLATTSTLTCMCSNVVIEAPRMMESHGESGVGTVIDDHRRQQILAGLLEGSVATTNDLLLRGSPSEIEAELRETHLPKLAEAGYIEWDPETGTISKGPRFEELEARLDPDPAPDP